MKNCQELFNVDEQKKFEKVNNNCFDINIEK